MRVICRFVDGSGLTDERLREGFTSATIFHLTLRREYGVHAISLWGSGLVVLIVDDTDVPRWQPIELFSIVDHRLPSHWEFDVGTPGDAVKALWGYSTLVRDPDHHDLLSELAPDALKVFWLETGYRA